MYGVDKGAQELQDLFAGLDYEKAAAIVALATVSTLAVAQGAAAFKYVKKHVDFKNFGASKLKFDKTDFGHHESVDAKHIEGTHRPDGKLGDSSNFAPIQKNFQNGLNKLVTKLDRSDIIHSINEIEGYLKTHPDIKWNIDRRVLEKIPTEMWKNAEIKPCKQGIGVQVTIRDAKGNVQHRIRIDQGQPNHRHPNQRVDHVEVRFQEDYVDLNGNLHKTKNDATHINGEDFINTNQWDKMR
jgi:hypothetical protein